GEVLLEGVGRVGETPFSVDRPADERRAARGAELVAERAGGETALPLGELRRNARLRPQPADVGPECVRGRFLVREVTGVLARDRRHGREGDAADVAAVAEPREERGG